MHADNAKAACNFVFRHLHPHVLLGTASDRYSGWIGQIYTASRYEGRMTQRVQKVGSKSFTSTVLPVDSVREYFEHFSALEIDFTFYSLLLNPDGKPTHSYRTLERYAEHLPPDARVLLKVPQKVCAWRLWTGSAAVSNPSFLDPDLFRDAFYEPAVHLLGDRLAALIFEQEYHRKDDRLHPEDLANRLAAFFDAAPKDTRYHVELRTESYLSPPIFRVLGHYGVGQVMSHWTWLPSLRQQWQRSGQRFFNASRWLVVRLLTPRGMRYEEAYARAHPFDHLVEDMIQPSLFQETADLVARGLKADQTVCIIINNRAGGNAPLLARQLVMTLMERSVL
ncbi:DUF72 domain-containing protein [Desulfosoma caldarium]|uniref:Uncharacterized protein YecE (DUF72 family) n=1 Tax=Desulfosoma caldarium TaxID=610254 RepID=A0A3N1ULN3_9BACT|nr:DUF72 domain-containing protein [Desulfosoma caldarium]ROQ90993.1 uncharacterized protein YecE (DUF72 family) [Desulfosoma caldarium]